MTSFSIVGKTSEVAVGTARAVLTVEGEDVLVCNVDGRFYAIENVCTHDGWPLDQGEICGTKIECPRHGARFDVTTGAVLALPAIIPVRTFAVHVEDEDIYVDGTG